MATTYKNAGLTLSNGSEATVYTAPALTTSIVKTIMVANTTSTSVSATVKWYDATTPFVLANAIPVPANSTPTILSSSALILEAGDAIKATSSNSSGFLDITVAVQENS